MVNIQSKRQARKLVREAQAKANEQRAQRDRDNVDDMAVFLVARTRLAGVDEWQAERVAQIALEADRRRDEFRAEGAKALERIRGRGESVGAIAALANVSESEVRSLSVLGTPVKVRVRISNRMAATPPVPNQRLVGARRDDRRQHDDG